MYIQGRILGPGDDLTEAINIRKKVFVEELNIAESEVFDDMDKYAVHALAYESKSDDDNFRDETAEKTAVATGRLLYDGEICRIDKVSVLREHRNKKYGDFIVRLLLNRAFIAGIDEVEVNAYATSEDFFRKIGFEKVGEEFFEKGLKKCKMTINSKKIVKNCSKYE